MEDQSTGQWSNEQIFLCESDVCFNGLISSYQSHSRILSFGEDADGKNKSVNETDVAVTMLSVTYVPLFI